MSWDSYLELLMVDSVTEAAIYGLDGNVWVSTEGLKNVTAEQIKVLAGEADVMHSCGPKLGALKCYLLTDDRKIPESLCLHLKTSPQDGKLPVCVGKSNTALVVVIGSGAANKLTAPVFKVVNHLMKVGY